MANRQRYSAPAYWWKYPSHTYPWDDLRFPSQGINPAGAAAAPTVDTTLAGFPGTLVFSGTLQNVVTGIAQMPHHWKEGSSITPHIHWARMVTATTGIQWDFYYRRSNPVGGTWEAWQGPVTVTDTTSPGTLDVARITSFGSIAMTDYTLSALINWRVDRRGDLDASGDDARLFEFDIHYQIDSMGSAQETSK